jgi:hypothetical protein
MPTPKPRTTAKQILDLLCRQGATGVSADDIMKIVQPHIDDTARLDWLEETRSCALALCGDDNNGNPTRHVWEVGNVDPSKYRDTLRAAIDASRKAHA